MSDERRRTTTDDDGSDYDDNDYKSERYDFRALLRELNGAPHKRATTAQPHSHLIGEKDAYQYVLCNQFQ